MFHHFLSLVVRPSVVRWLSYFIISLGSITKLLTICKTTNLMKCGEYDSLKTTQELNLNLPARMLLSTAYSHFKA